MKNFKRMVAIFFSLAMILAFMSTMAFADTPVAKIGEHQYSTLADALKAASSGDTIEILAGTWGADAVGTLTTSEAQSVREKSLTIQPAQGASVKFTSDVILGVDNNTTSNSSMTVKNINFEGATLGIDNYVQVMVEGCTFNGNGSDGHYSAALCIRDSCDTNGSYSASDSTVTVENCIINGTDSGKPGIRLRNTGNVTLTGNTVKNASHNGILFESNTAALDNTLAKTISVIGNTIKEWNAGNASGGGRAMRLDLGTLADGSTISIKDNYFIKETVGLDAPDFVKITGAGNASVDLNHNSWNNSPLETVSGNAAYYTSNGATPALASVICDVAQGVAKIGDVTYETLADAIAAVPTDDTETTITMIADEATANDETLTIAAGKNIVLDLNGKTISGTGTAKELYYITNSGTLEITDTSANENGKITALTTNPDKGYSKENVTLYNLGGTLTLTKGTIENTTGAGLAYAVNNSSNAWGSSVVSTFNMNGGTVSAPGGDASLRVYQNTGVNWKVNSKNYVNIAGGTITDSGIFVDTFLHTKDQDITGYTADDITKGSVIDTKINISGGTINGLVDMKIRHPFNTKLNITGGDFTNSKMRVRKVASEYGKEATAGTLAEPTAPMVSISGGKFKFNSASEAFGLSSDYVHTSWTNYEKPYDVSGGVFSVDLNNYSGIQFPAGQTGVANEDEATMAEYPYTVGKDFVAQIGETKYRTLADAIAAVPADGTETTITMIGDEAVAAGVTIAAGKNVVLELNGKTISGNTDSSTTYALITNRGTLTVQDSTDTNKDGTGNGLITTYITNPDQGDVPGYASNTITNNGTLTVKSGKIVNNGSGYACYAIDNQTNGTSYTPVLNIEGGRMEKMNAYTYAVRMFCNSTTKTNTVNVSGGVITGGYGLWLQTPNNKANKAALNITGGTIDARDGAALYVGGTKADNSNISIAISDGTIKGTGAIIQGPLSGTYGSVAISGGEFKNVQCGASVENFISGGYFNNEPNSTYIAEGYEAAKLSEGPHKDWYLVGKVVATASTTGNIEDDSSLNEVTYTAGTVVNDEDDKPIEGSGTTNLEVTVSGNTNDTGENGEAGKAPAMLNNIKDQGTLDAIVKTAIENAGSNIEDNQVVNIEVTLVKSEATISDGKAVYEVHPEAIVTVNNKVVDTIQLTNDKLTNSFSFKLYAGKIANVGDKIKVTHISGEESNVAGVFEVANDGFITVTGITSFSNFELEPITESSPVGNINYERTIALGDCIDIVYYVCLPTGTAATDYRIEYTFNGAKKTEVLGGSHETKDNYDRYRFVLASCNATQMTENVDVRVYYIGQAAPIKTSTVSVKSYCVEQINREGASEKLKNICKSTLDYGTYAQKYVPYKNTQDSDLANGGTDYLNMLTMPEPAAIAKSGKSAGLKSVLRSLVMHSKTQLNVYFDTTSEDYSLSKYDITVTNNRTGESVDVTPKQYSSTRILVPITGISACDLDDRYTVTIQNKNDTNVFSYTLSPLNYLYAGKDNTTQREGGTANLGALCKAFYNYYYYAEEYFSQPQS